MQDLNAILRHRDFWRFYAFVSDDPLDREVLSHFGPTKINERRYAEATICMPCGCDYLLELKIIPHLRTSNLGLRRVDGSSGAEMGWWDDARWHPFALRWSELERLHQLWLTESSLEIHPSAAFLLLAMFVGHGVDERELFGQRKNAIASHLEQLQLFKPVEILELVDRIFVLPSAEDYNWSQDRELGWVFGGDYACYSIRNREHWNGSEGRFPFGEWAMIVDHLPPAG